MARRSNRESTETAAAGSATAVAMKDSGVSDRSERDVKRGDSLAKSRMNGNQSAGASSGGTARRGFFDIYKRGQGQNTRVGSGVGAGIFVCWFAYFLYQKMALVSTNPATAKLWQVGVSVGVIVVCGLVLYWLLALKRSIADFLIATEGEMKKVNWTSRKEIIGSTKVVIIVTVGMSVLLFTVDLFFMELFGWIGILKGGGGVLTAIRELF